MDVQVILYIIPLTLSLYIFTTHFINKLKNLPPNPLLNFPFIGHLYLLKKPLHRTLANLSNTYGPVFFLQFGSRRILVVSSPSAAEECFTTNDVVFANRPHILAGKHIGYNYTSLTLTSYGDHWRNLRKISSVEILSTQKLQMMQGIRIDEIKSMIRTLLNYHASSSTSPVDMKSVFLQLTINVMMRMIAGKRYYGGDNSNLEEMDEAKRFKEILVDTFKLSGPCMEDFLPVFKVLKWLGLGASHFEERLVELQKRRDGFMQELVQEFKMKNVNSTNTENKLKKTTMIEILLELQAKEPEYYKDSLIRSLMLSLLAAGSDTSAGTIEWALSLLLNNPQVLKKAQLEIDSHVGYDRLIDESDIPDLPYLRSIVNETLRMYPAGPLLVPHESSEPCMVGGYRVPAGTMLLVNCWAIHNDPKNWEDPRNFKPERFEGLEGTREGFKWMPFGSGRRGCPGESLALRMMCFGLGSVIQCYDWERVGKELVDMTEGGGLTMPRATPLMAYCKARPSAAKILAQI